MKICVVTGSRAEYGLLKNLIFKLKNDNKFKLYLIVTGTHLSKQFGATYKEINKDGLKIDKKVNLDLKSDTSKGIINSISKGLDGFVDIYKKLNPDLLLVLGDRYEIFAASLAAYFSRIPIAHLHGGESTEGSTDEAIRHSITKMSHLHFVAAKEYKRKVIQLGENPKNVFNVGGLGVDSIKHLNFLSKKEIEKKLNIKFKKKNILINFHPETLNKFSTKKILKEILLSLEKIKNTNFIFTMPNADLESQIIFKMIKKFVKENKNCFYFNSLGTLKFLSCIRHVDCMIGNSSSGLLEMPTFKKGTINIGKRQLGRLSATSVINVKANKNEIIRGIRKIYSNKFKLLIKKTKNPYGNGGASNKIIRILKKTSLKNIIIKKFYSIK